MTRLTGGTVVKGDEVVADSVGDNNTRTACRGDGDGGAAVEATSRRDRVRGNPHISPRTDVLYSAYSTVTIQYTACRKRENIYVLYYMCVCIHSHRMQ